MAARTKYTDAARIFVAVILFGAATASTGLAQYPPVKKAPRPVATVDGTLILGAIESITVNDMANPASGGRMLVAGKQITIPDNLSIGVPKARTTLQKLVLDAPAACKAQTPPQSGLAVSDTCRKDTPPALARIVAKAAPSGDLVASLVMVQKDSGTTLARFQKERRSRRGRYQTGESGAYATQPAKPPQ